jgi:RNA polymerase sigma-70 factor (ECF subfamily)
MATVAALDDARVVAALRRGDEATFASLVDRLHPALVRIARGFVGSTPVAEDIARQSWGAVLERIDSFDGSRPLTTWIVGIVVAGARDRVTERPSADVDDQPAVDPGRFLDDGHDRWPHHWATPPQRWDDVPEERLLGREARVQIEMAIATLPPMQRHVLQLRDVVGLNAADTCALLALTATEQRRCLHRARSRVRRDLEDHLESEAG